MVYNKKDSYYILMVEDDADDRYITESTFAENGFGIKLEFLTDSSRVMPFLDNCGEENVKPFPDLIILDKNLPPDDGLEVLKLIKAHPLYKKIPVVMVSGTAHKADVEKAYELGVNSFIEKPSNNHLTVEKISSFVKYWFEIVSLPELV